jgi:branched-chain amino acid aminotransferase
MADAAPKSTPWIACLPARRLRVSSPRVASMRAWLNGTLLADPTQGAVAVTDHGFTVGDGVFEAVKTLGGEPFALTRHLARLERSAAGLGLPAPDLEDVRRGVAAVLADGATADPIGRLRITWTAGPAPMGSGRGGGPATLVVAYSAIDVAASETTVVTVPWTRNEQGATAGLKTTSYAENVIALAHAQAHGGTEAILANTAGHLCEGTGSNVFYVLDGELRTPSLAAGCLAGITRELVVEWCGAREVDEPLADVREQASEAFLVSTTRDVQAIVRWDDRELPAPGPVTQRCAETWSAREAETMDP